MKHDNVCMYDAFLWNWSKNVVCDAIFIASYINDAIGDEIWWFIIYENIKLGTTIPKFEGCIEFIIGMFIKIHKPWIDVACKDWFNGCKNIYSMDNTVVIGC